MLSCHSGGPSERRLSSPETDSQAQKRSRGSAAQRLISACSVSCAAHVISVMDVFFCDCLFEALMASLNLQFPLVPEKPSQDLVCRPPEIIAVLHRDFLIFIPDHCLGTELHSLALQLYMLS